MSNALWAWVQLAKAGEDNVALEHCRGAARMKARILQRRDLPLAHAHGAQGALGDAFRAVKVVLAGRAVPGLGRPACEDGCELHPLARAASVRLSERGPEFKEPQLLRSAMQVVANVFEERDEHRGAHDAMIAREWIRDADEIPTAARSLHLLLSDEAEIDGLAEPAGDERSREGIGGLGQRWQAARLADDGGQRGGNLRIAVDAGDFLDEIDLACEIDAPRRGRDDELLAVGARYLAAEVDKQIGDLGLGE
jgi:hypothetical protein